MRLSRYLASRDEKRLREPEESWIESEEII
jgi:hypothetical protein